MTYPVPTDHPLHERFDERRAAAARLRAAVVQAKTRLKRPALEAVLTQGPLILIADGCGYRHGHFWVGEVFARFPGGQYDRATEFVEKMR